MAIDNSEVLVKFKGDPSSVENAEKEINKSFDNLKVGAVAAATLITTAFAKMGTDIVASGIEYNAQMETYLARLETLVGTEKEASQIMQQIKKDAITTPFDVSSLTQAESLLLSTGLNADEVRETILALGDAVSASGGGNAELQRMAVNLQQIKNVGKASSLDIKQFAYAGIDIYGLLADSLGITREEASKTEVTYEMLSKALQKATQKGGKYYNAMVKQSKTYNGAMSNLKESIQVFNAELSKGLFEGLKNIIPHLSNMFNWLAKNKDIILAIIKPLGIFSATVLGLVGISKVTEGFKLFFAVLKAHPLAIITGALAGLVSIFMSLTSKESEFSKKHKEVMNQLEQESAQIDNETQSWKDLQEAQKNSIDVGMTELAHTQSLYEELKTLVDTNGKVKEGYEERAKFITGVLSDSLGIEISMTDGVIQNYQNLQTEIEKTMELKKAQIILNASEELYTESIKEQLKAQKKLSSYSKKVEDIKKDLIKAEQKYEQSHSITSFTILAGYKQELDAAENNYKKQEDLVNSYYYNIAQYEKNYEYFKNQEYDKITNITWDYVKDFQKAGDAEKAQLEDQIKVTQDSVNQLKKLKKQSGSDIYDQQIKDGEKQIELLKNQLSIYTSTSVNGYDEAGKKSVASYNNGLISRIPSATTAANDIAGIVQGILGNKEGSKQAGINVLDGLGEGLSDNSMISSIISNISRVSNTIINTLKNTLGIHSPSKITRNMGENLIEGFNLGLDKEKKTLFDNINDIGKNILGDFGLNSNINVSPSLLANMNTGNSQPIINVYNNMELDPLGQVVSNIKTFSGGAKNDYNYGAGV